MNVSKQMPPGVLKSWTVAFAALLAAGYGMLLFAESFMAPAGCCLATWPQANPLQAQRLVQARDPKGMDAPAERAAALEILRGRPADPSAWLRLAVADRLAHGRLTPEGQKALDASYSVTPYAGQTAILRSVFVLDNWNEVAIRTRQDALTEIGILKGDHNALMGLKAATPAIHERTGRIIAALEGVLEIPPARPAAPAP
jgi:hypothetical protein